MKRRDFLKKLAILPAIVITPDVLGRVIPDLVTSPKLEPWAIGEVDFIPANTAVMSEIDTITGFDPAYGPDECYLAYGQEQIYIHAGVKKRDRSHPAGSKLNPVNSFQEAIDMLQC